MIRRLNDEKRICLVDKPGLKNSFHQKLIKTKQVYSYGAYLIKLDYLIKRYFEQIIHYCNQLAKF
jgi:hypothetical protein